MQFSFAQRLGEGRLQGARHHQATRVAKRPKPLHSAAESHFAEVQNSPCLPCWNLLALAPDNAGDHALLLLVQMPLVHLPLVLLRLVLLPLVMLLPIRLPLVHLPLIQLLLVFLLLIFLLLIVSPLVLLPLVLLPLIHLPVI